MNNICDFALEIEYNAKLKEYWEWEVEIQKDYNHLSTENADHLIAKGLVSHEQVVRGFDIEPQQMALAS